ncbi:prepilin-type N-terminal cleavage/methylation domain-containing protein [Paraliobacillus sp. JSM ZJ581]|uniref:prepilin-type N-terminal cleavage/methylation domain-containing protein n=1 Tax=Paraliobacillus sp. JSM ZJ581 TaxID=3342118 RepID=UPI0035A90EAC
MVNKLKKVLRSEKGFTLVELLAVIVILAIIVAIAVPAIGNVIESAETNASEAEIELVLDAARLADAEGNFTDGMSVADLVTGGYLEDDGELPTGTISFVEASNTYELK